MARRALLLLGALLLSSPRSGSVNTRNTPDRFSVLSPTSDAVSKQKQLGELQTWGAALRQCHDKRCDALGCSCSNRAQDYTMRESDGPVSWLVLFCVPWAEKCNKFKKLIGEVSKDLQDVYKIGYVDAEAEKNVATAHLNVHAYPTMLAYPMGFGGGRQPVRFSGPKTMPGKLASWALSQLPSRITQVWSSSDLFRGKAEVHVVLMNDKAKTPAGFKAAALRHTKFAPKASECLHFAEIRRERVAQLTAGKMGAQDAAEESDLSDLVRRFGLQPNDASQWPQLLIITPASVTPGNLKFVFWQEKHYTVRRLLGFSMKSFYSSNLENYLQPAIAGFAAIKSSPQSPGSGAEAGGCVDEGPWECFATGCPQPTVTCAELALQQHACDEPLNPANLRRPGESVLTADAGRMIREVCPRSCGVCKPDDAQGQGHVQDADKAGGAKQPAQTQKPKADAAKAQEVRRRVKEKEQEDHRRKVAEAAKLRAEAEANRAKLKAEAEEKEQEDRRRKVAEAEAAKLKAEAEANRAKLKAEAEAKAKAKADAAVAEKEDAARARAEALAQAHRKNREFERERSAAAAAKREEEAEARLAVEAQQAAEARLAAERQAEARKAAEDEAARVRAEKDQAAKVRAEKDVADQHRRKMQNADALRDVGEQVKAHHHRKQQAKAQHVGGEPASRQEQLDQIEKTLKGSTRGAEDKEDRDLAAKIEHIGNLHKQGDITQAEYEAALAKLVQLGEQQQQQRKQPQEQGRASPAPPTPYAVAEARLRALDEAHKRGEVSDELYTQEKGKLARSWLGSKQTPDPAEAAPSKARQTAEVREATAQAEQRARQQASDRYADQMQARQEREEREALHRQKQKLQDQLDDLKKQKAEEEKQKQREREERERQDEVRKQEELQEQLDQLTKQRDELQRQRAQGKQDL